MQWEPHKYQVEARNFLLDRKFAALFLDPGLGKTSIVLSALKKLSTPKTLIIAPLRVCYNVWPGEIQKWSNFFDIRISIVHGDKEKAFKVDADIYIMNPEGLPWLGEHPEVLSGFKVLVVDELTKFKHTNTKRFKILRPLLKLFDYRWGLTGSPASNGLEDLFGQVYVLDAGKTFGQYITHFRNYYFVQDYNGFGWRIRPGAMGCIMEKIAPFTLSMTATDHLDMPELLVQDIHVDLPPDAMRVYKELERDLITILQDETVVTATNAGAALSKCMQVANGGIYIDGGGWKGVHSAKVDALDSLREELQKPLLVAYNFVHDVQRYQEATGKMVAFIGGGVAPQRASELINLWNASKLDMLFGHPGAIAHGVNLQGGSNHLCWYSLTWNLEHYDQFIRRIYRQGMQHDTVVVHRIIAKGTVDEVIVKALESKMSTQNDVFTALKRTLT